MFEKFSRSWELVKASAAVLRSDKELMVFPIVSGARHAGGAGDLPGADRSAGACSSTASAWPARCWCSCSTSASTRVIIFFNCALVGAAMIRLRRRRSDAGRRLQRGQGAPAGDPRLRGDRGDGRHAAAGAEGRTTTSSCACSAAAWARRGRWRPSWSCRCWSARRSARSTRSSRASSLLKRTWGENAIGNVGIGVAFGLIMFARDRWSARCWRSSPRSCRWRWRSWSACCS